MNLNREIKIEKVTINIGAGKDQKILENAVKLIEYMTGGITPVKTKASKRIPAWGLRPGLPIGCKLTMRGPEKVELLKKVLKAKVGKIKKSNFDQEGNLSLGVHEYIDVPDIKYNPDIALIGFQICVTFKRNGYRIKNRRIMKKKVPSCHKITQDEAIEFMKKEFNITVEEK